MLHYAPKKKNIKNRESNNLLHGSVAKLSNHFMIRARRRAQFASFGTKKAPDKHV